MPADITAEQWQPIDEAIFAKHILAAVRQIRSAGNCGLREAMELLHARYAKLRAEAPDRFACTDQDYWAGFYS